MHVPVHPPLTPCECSEIEYSTHSLDSRARSSVAQGFMLGLYSLGNRHEISLPPSGSERRRLGCDCSFSDACCSSFSRPLFASPKILSCIGFSKRKAPRKGLAWWLWVSAQLPQQHTHQPVPAQASAQMGRGSPPACRCRRACKAAGSQCPAGRPAWPRGLRA